MDLQVYGQGQSSVESKAPSQQQQAADSAPSSLRSAASEDPLSRFGGHRGSISTNTTDSTDSSPITSNSFRGVSSLADTPGTSPDTAQGGPLRGAAETGNDLRFSPTVSGVRKPRNIKSLALNTSKTFPLSRGFGTELAPLETPFEAMPSPTPLSTGFVRPAPQRRRNPSLSLSIQTPTTEASPGFSLPQTSQAAVPPTPSLTRPSSFRTFQSSSALPTLLTTSDDNGSRKFASLGGFQQVPAEEDERSYDVPSSREEKLPNYHAGPVCVYEPYIDLFLEPTAAQAREYDVILNVASEVLNPFTGQTGAEVPSKSLKTVTDELLNDAPARASVPGEPEYIHIPWEHNSDIVRDLYDVVKVMDDRVQQKKRILVHCQCGVSRSASLVVAYGVYKNPAIAVQDAYDYVKSKSEWIGPNMGLVMQLQEFRSSLIKTTFSSGNTRSNSRVLHSRVPTNSSTTRASDEPQIPQTAPLPEISSKHLPPPIATSTFDRVLPGPSSAPSGMRWPSEPAPPLPRPQSLGSDSSATPTLEAPTQDNSSMRFVDQLLQKNTVRPSSPHRRVVPLAPINVEFPMTGPSSQPLETPRGQEFAMTSNKPSDLDETFGITSPRVDSFPSMLKASEDLPGESPRAEVFAMAPVVPPELDDTLTLGLTSPRTEGFFELPHRFTTSPPRPKMHRPVALQPTQSQIDAQAVAALRTQLGFSHSQSASDAQAASVPVLRQAPPAADHQAPTTLATAVDIPDSIRQAHEETDFSDALMSPRAVEFTSNPMRDAMAAATMANGKGKGKEMEVSDPRSPPVKGANPITRDIFDVLGGDKKPNDPAL